MILGYFLALAAIVGFLTGVKRNNERMDKEDEDFRRDK
jgi:hypothetical protein